VKTCTKTRELIEFQLQGATVRGTYHRPDDATTESRIGIFFLNSLAPSRAATGDSAVYWADALAKEGYPCFRFDLPGFGDSDGDPPSQLMDYINSGGYAPAASEAIAELVQRFNLDGAVIVGLCAGAVSALYTASNTLKCKGLVLMDPYFFLPFTRRTKLWYRIWQKLTGRIARSAFGRKIGYVYSLFRSFCLPWIRKSLPQNANIQLLRCWKGVANSGVPILVFNAASLPKKGEFDYTRHILKLVGRKGQVKVSTIENAGHTFSNRLGRTAVQNHIATWLHSLFAPDVRSENAVDVLHVARS
jgi:pimeloyl-ACP methyl ester carboxylesterase